MFLLLEKIIVIPFLLFLSNSMMGQSGPGGVGNATTNKIWLDANEHSQFNSGDRVTIFSDRSGNKYNFLQSSVPNAPTFLTNALNGRSAIRFDRSKALQYLEITAPGIGDVMSNTHTIFAVARATTGSHTDFPNNQGILQAIVSSEGYHSGLFFEGYPNTVALNFQQWTSSLTGQSVRYTPVKDGDWSFMSKSCIEQGSNTELSGYCNGIKFGSMTTALPMLNYHNQLRLGTSRNNIGAQHAWPLNGDIAEVIIYNTLLNNAQRIIVENYLSAKYNLPTANDFYINNPSSYCNNVQGIGTTDGTASNKHSYSANSEGLTIQEKNNSLDSPNEFIFSGHSLINNSYVTTEILSGIDKRWGTDWYVEKSIGSSIEIDLSFKLPEGEVLEEDKEYCLLYRGESTSSFQIVKDAASVSSLTPTVKSINFTLSSDLRNGYYTYGIKPKSLDGEINGNFTVLNSMIANTSIVIASKQIRFLYKEEYKPGNLRYSIYNYKKEPVQNLPVIYKTYGDNFLSIDFTDVGLIDGQVYTLEVVGEKSEKFYTIFKYRN